jgi:hypothetical protein
MTESAQLFHGVHDTPVYTDVLFNKPLRLPVVIPLGVGVPLTAVATLRLLDSGHARAALIVGLSITAAVAIVGALIPTGRPSIGFRLHALWRTLRPKTISSNDHPLLAPPAEVIGNLRFTAHGVYADYLLSGVRYHLQPTKRRIAAADLHRNVVRELPSGSWIYGLAVPQDQRQLLRAMLDGHRDRPEWVAACRALAPVLAAEQPSTRLYWLSVPVDSGRGGHSPLGQLTRLRDWLAGRDKESDSSVAAYRRLADDITSALPEEFSPEPVTPAMIEWFWRHNAWRGTYTEPLRRSDGDHGTDFPPAQFDDGDQHHRPHRWLPSRQKALRVAGGHSDSYQAILPVVAMPKQGIAFPGSEFLDALDDLDTGAVFDFAIHLQMRSRELELTRNDRAKNNIDDQFGQRRDARDGAAELHTALRQLAEYNRQLADHADERAVEAAFLIAVGAQDPQTLDYSIKRLRDALSASGQIVVRHYRGAQTRLWAGFNPGAPIYRSGVDQFAHPTTAKKWSRFVPLTSSQVGNATGVLLGFNKANTLNSAVLIDLPGAARRNHNPCLICAGAPGYGKSYAAKRLVRSEIQRGSQAFIIDPGTEWATALGDRPRTAVIDMAGVGFGCDPLRIFPHHLAGGYWLDYLLPMTGIDARSVAAARLRSLLAPDSRRRLGLTSTAALIAHLADLDDDDLRPALVTLQSWATHDFTQAIFDPTLPVPDLAALDIAIWLTGSLDLPTAQEMSNPHLYRSLSERKLASVAIYGMLVRLARVSFFANRQRFGLIVLEEAGALLNSRAGADDAHLISRRARKHYTGMVIITQDPIADLELMGDQFITQKLIMPFEDDDLARRVVPTTGIRLADYPDIEEYFLARTPADQLRDPGTLSSAAADFGAARRGDRQGCGYFVDEFRRVAPIRVAAEPDRGVHDAFDTTPGTA